MVACLHPQNDWTWSKYSRLRTMENSCQEKNKYSFRLSIFSFWSKFTICEIKCNLEKEWESTLLLLEKNLSFKVCFRFYCVCMHTCVWSNSHSTMNFTSLNNYAILSLSTKLTISRFSFLTNAFFNWLADLIDLDMKFRPSVSKPGILRTR